MRKFICKDTGEVVYGYKRYLSTDHWKKVKTRMYNSKYKYECYCCKKKSGLQLHHKSYKTVGNENLNHLIWLCPECHQEVHDYLSIYNSMSTNLWNVARKIRKKKERKRN